MPCAEPAGEAGGGANGATSQPPACDAAAEGVAESPAKKARTEPPLESGDKPPADASAGEGGKPPKFSEKDGTYVAAGDGWWAHKAGQWLFNLQEHTYFHLSTGKLVVEAGDGQSTAPFSSDTWKKQGGDAEAAPPVCRHRGTVAWFNAVKGFGFIRPEAGGEDLFVHRSELRASSVEEAAEPEAVSLEEGDAVTFELGTSENGRICAVSVERADAGAPGDGEEGEEEDAEDDASSSASSVELDLEAELKAGSFQEKGPQKDHCEDFVVEKLKIPISVLGETASCFFFGVFDGHGGPYCAEFAAAHLATNVLARLRDRAKAVNDEMALRTALLAGFKQTEHNFLQQAKRTRDSSGSTACTMTVFGPDEQMRLRLFLANLGDSRAVLGRADGTAFRLTEDHKPDLPAEKKRIEAEGGSVVEVAGVWRVILPMKKRAATGIVGLAVSRALGDKEFKKPDIVSSEPSITIREVDWEADEFVILATDGVWDVITDKDAVLLVQRSLRKGESEAKAAEALVRRAQSRGSVDDCTALVVKFGWLKTASEPTAPAEDEAGDNAEEAAQPEEAKQEAPAAPSAAAQAAAPDKQAVDTAAAAEDADMEEEEEDAGEDEEEEEDDDEPADEETLKRLMLLEQLQQQQLQKKQGASSSSSATPAKAGGDDDDMFAMSEPSLPQRAPGSADDMFAESAPASAGKPSGDADNIFAMDDDSDDDMFALAADKAMKTGKAETKPAKPDGASLPGAPAAPSAVGMGLFDDLPAEAANTGPKLANS